MSAKREGGLLEEALTHSVIGAFYDDLTIDPMTLGDRVICENRVKRHRKRDGREE